MNSQQENSSDETLQAMINKSERKKVIAYHQEDIKFLKHGLSTSGITCGKHS